MQKYFLFSLTKIPVLPISRPSPSTRRPFARGRDGRRGSGARGFGFDLNLNSRADSANAVRRGVARLRVGGPGSESRSGLARSLREFLRDPGDRKRRRVAPPVGHYDPSGGPSPLARARARAIGPQRSEGKRNPRKAVWRAPRGDPLFVHAPGRRPPPPLPGASPPSSQVRENPGAEDARPRDGAKP